MGDDVYGGTYRYFERVHRPSGVDARYVDLAAGPDALWEAMTARTRLVWFESPTNPFLKLTDIAAVAATVRERAAQAGDVGPLIVVDNTFASPAHPAPAGPRGRHRLPLRDEVPRRALGHDPWRGGHE